MKEEEMKESVNQSVSQSVIVCGKKKGELKKIAVSVDLPLSITQLRQIVATENEILNQLLFFLPNGICVCMKESCFSSIVMGKRILS